MSTVSETMLNIKKKIEILQKKRQELLKVVNKDEEKSTNSEETVNLTLNVQSKEEQWNSGTVEVEDSGTVQEKEEENSRTVQEEEGSRIVKEEENS